MAINKNIVNLSKQTKKSLFFNEDLEIDYERLEKKCNNIMELVNKGASLNLNISPSDAEILSKHLDSRKIRFFVDEKRYFFDKDYIDIIKKINSKWPVNITIDRLRRIKDDIDIKDQKIRIKIDKEELDTFSKEEKSEYLKKFNVENFDIKIDKAIDFQILDDLKSDNKFRVELR